MAGAVYSRVLTFVMGCFVKIDILEAIPVVILLDQTQEYIDRVRNRPSRYFMN